MAQIAISEQTLAINFLCFKRGGGRNLEVLVSMRSIHWLGAEGTNLSLPNLKSMLEVWKSKLSMRSFHFGGGGAPLPNLKSRLEVQVAIENFSFPRGGGAI